MLDRGCMEKGRGLASKELSLFLESRYGPFSFSHHGQKIAETAVLRIC